MSYDQPGEDILDLRDIEAAVLTILDDISAELGDAGEEDLAEQFDAHDLGTVIDAIDGEDDDAEKIDAAITAAGQDGGIDYLRAVANLESDLGTSLERAAWDEPCMIHEDYFENYAMQLAEDLGLLEESAAWPACHIDWGAAADSLKMDYTEVEFDGNAYFIRLG